MKRYPIATAAVCLGLVLLGLENSAAVNEFADHARQRAADAPAAGKAPAMEAVEAAVRLVTGEEQEEGKSEIRRQIQAEADKRRVAPVNARLDPVWKAIPGYNGLEVDVEATFKLAQQGGGEPLKLIYKEVPPAIGLDQLGPQPVYKGNPNKKMAGMMINVAWGDEFLEPMLATLRQEGVHATFFFDGMWLKKNAETARRILAEGHEAGNHAYSHKDMSKLDRMGNLTEISKTEALLTGEVGIRNRLFAPPSGDYSQTTVQVAHELKLRTILWTLDTIDWKKPSPASIVDKVRTRVEPGTLILMHPTASSSGALKGMIQAIRSKGLTLGTVSEVISPDRLPEVESARQ
ncbi:MULTISPECIES: polysaccharide deacetylase family protein [Paenibacillus]|uniref:polysaccharide deacetylase family protein n=1 Tax=Paenibacillus TaxID=44249 RepID=UPI0022B8CD75|nr:polysaccharide deacetylase family protein [Paenibacillus caseinilyticus]MCZ8520004.1 polysaccharide deacetylase family protein [Paenibacillus caseinilyticus]